MRETGLSCWTGKLEAEIARELGQPVSLVAGGDLPDETRSVVASLQLPGVRLAVAADGEELVRILVEGRLIEAEQGDPSTVRELWTGILASVCARLGGTIAPAGGTLARPMEPCLLKLGNATMRMGLAVDAEAIPEPSSARAGNYDLLLEVELDASVRFGSREMELKDLLELGPGDVVELDRQVADAVDLIVGDKIVARGEVVLVNGNFGLRVTEIAEPTRRLESIRGLY